MVAKKRLLPTGECWCGCRGKREPGDKREPKEQEPKIGSFFLPGHDKYAESAVIKMKYGGIPNFLVAHGFGPEGQNLRDTYKRWQPEH